MPHEYEDEARLELDATPDEVWDAIATGPGMDAWFMGRTEVEPHAGGAVRADMGPYVEEFEVTAYEPQHRFAFRSKAREDGSFIALEWLIEGRERGTTVLRTVAHGFIGADDWETEYDATTKGGAMYLHTLGQYVTHFLGRPAVPVNAFHPPAGDLERTWTLLRDALGLTAPPAEGDAVRLTPAGFDPIDGIVDLAQPEFLGVRTDDALYRFFTGIDAIACIGHHLFFPADRQQANAAWQGWLARVLA